MPTVPPLWVGGRSFDFGDISSSGVAAVEVYKSANAILPTGGLGATINMVTTKPIDGKNGGGISRDTATIFSIDWFCSYHINSCT